ncbi:hypothetical protein WDW89_18585 [Deltaproteobacteria bacterium TL4]
MSTQKRRKMEIIQKQPLEDQSIDREFLYNTFYDNLRTRLTPNEVHSMGALGDDFFELVDRFTLEFFINRGGDCLLLELTRKEFLWELQIFVNLFIRECCGNVLKLREFCKKLREKLKAEDFRQEFMEVMATAYQEHFYIEDCKSAYLV